MPNSRKRGWISCLGVSSPKRAFLAKRMSQSESHKDLIALWRKQRAARGNRFRRDPVSTHEATREKGSAARRRRAREAAAGGGWTPQEWLVLLARYGGTCLACGVSERLVPDHVQPLYRGGRHSIDNIQPLCYRCNLRKGIKTIDYRSK